MLYSSPLKKTLVAALAALLLCTLARADVTLGPNGDQQLTPEEQRLSSFLGPEYKDEAHGFKINTLAGARNVQKTMGDSASERLNFVDDQRNWAGTIQSVFFKPQSFPPEDYLKSSAAELAAKFSAVQILDSRVTTVSKKPAARLIASMEIVASTPEFDKNQHKSIDRPVGKASMVKCELAVQVATNEYLVLTLWGPLASKDDLVHAFDALTSTFEVYDQEQVKNRRIAAIQAGKDWFSHRSAEELTSRLVKDPQLFRVKIAGKDIGYIRFDEKVETVVGFKGVGVYSLSRTFPTNDLVVMTFGHYFWAYSRQDSLPNQIVQYSMWENNVENVTVKGTAATRFWTKENGSLQFEIPGDSPRALGAASDIRGGHFVFNVLRDAGNDANILTNTLSPPIHGPLPLDGPTPLPKILEYLWPRLTDLSKPQTNAFVVFNSGANPSRLGLRILSVLGPDTVNLDGRSIAATKLLDEMDPGSTTLWVDSNAKTIMMRTSDNTLLLPTTEEKMAQLWTGRLAQLPKGTTAGKP